MRGWVLVAGAFSTVLLSSPAASGASASSPATVSPARSVALVRAALVDLSRRSAFKTVRTAPSLRVVTLVEPRRQTEAATLRFAGPRGPGTVRSVVASGLEDLVGDAAGWADFLLQAGAPPADVAQAASLAGTWYSTPSAVGFGPSLAGIGHVLCTGAGCSLAGARALDEPTSDRLVVELPHLSGRLLMRLGAHPLPLVFTGTGPNAGVTLRFGYPPAALPVTVPTSTAPLPPALGG